MKRQQRMVRGVRVPLAGATLSIAGGAMWATMSAIGTAYSLNTHRKDKKFMNTETTILYRSYRLTVNRNRKICDIHIDLHVQGRYQFSVTYISHRAAAPRAAHWAARRITGTLMTMIGTDDRAGSDVITLWRNSYTIHDGVL